MSNYIPPLDLVGRTSYKYLIWSLITIQFICLSCSNTDNIHQAVKEGDYKRVVRLVKNGVDVNEKDSVGSTPLYWAAGTGNTDITKYLIGKGADVNANFEFGGVPITAAVVGGTARHIEIIHLLVENGADINKNSDLFGTPLYAAVLKSDVQMVEILLKSGSDIYIKSSNGQTPLSLALFNNNTEIISLLKKYQSKNEEKTSETKPKDHLKTLNVITASSEFINRSINLGKDFDNIYSFENPTNEDELKYLSLLNNWTFLWIDIFTYFSNFTPLLKSEVYGVYYSIVFTALNEAITSSQFIGNRLLSKDHFSLIIKLLELKQRLLNLSLTLVILKSEMDSTRQPTSFSIPDLNSYYNDCVIMAKHFDFLNEQFHELYERSKDNVPSDHTDKVYNQLILDLCNSRISASRLLDNHNEFKIDEIYRVNILLDIIECITLYLTYKTHDINLEELLIKITELDRENRSANRNLLEELSSTSK